MDEPGVLKARDTTTGEIVKFRWNGAEPPTEADMAEVFAAHRARTPKPAVAAPAEPSMLSKIGDMAKQGVQAAWESPANPFATGMGAIKGAASTITGAGDMIRKAFPSTAALDIDTGGSRDVLKPQGAGEQAGFAGEQMAEFVLPGMAAEKIAMTGATRLLPVLAKGAAAPRAARAVGVAARSLGSGAAGAGVAAAQGDDPTAAALMGLAGPAIGAGVGAAGRWVGEKALPFVKSAIKVTDTQLKGQGDTARIGIAEAQDRLAKFLLTKRYTSAADAETAMQGLEQKLKGLYTSSDATMNAGTIQTSALDDLIAESRLRSDGGVQIIPKIEAEKKRLLRGPFAENAPAPTAAPNPSLPASATTTGRPGMVRLGPGQAQAVVPPLPLAPRPTGTPFSMSTRQPAAIEWKPAGQRGPVLEQIEEGAIGNNASGESGASAEAISRLRGMKQQGKQFVVLDRAGRERPLIGADAVDYVPAKGETHAIRNADGTYEVLTANGGRVPPPRPPVTATSQAPAASGTPAATPTPNVSVRLGGKKAVKVERQFREDVPIDEVNRTMRKDALDLKDNWGKPKQGKIEKRKNVALRTALKEAVPESAPILAEEGMTKQAKTALDAMAKRQANREPLSWQLMMGTSAAAGAGGAGHLKAAAAAQVLALGAHWLRNNPLKAGYLADDLAKALSGKDAVRAGQILRQLGVGAASAGVNAAGQP